MTNFDEQWIGLENKWDSAECSSATRACGKLLKHVWLVQEHDDPGSFLLGSVQLAPLNGFPGVKLVMGPGRLKHRGRLVQLQIAASESRIGWIELRLHVLRQRRMPHPTIPRPLRYMILEKWLAGSEDGQLARQAQEIVSFAEGYCRGLARCDEQYSRQWLRQDASKGVSF